MGCKSKRRWKIMNKYESVVIINPNLEAESIKALIEKFSNLINSNGTVNSVEELGKKRLAYEIKKLNEGYYIVVKFEAKPELITELERVYRITDEVMKFIVVKEEE
jgi:small subunit ribosomal protein S6